MFINFYPPPANVVCEGYVFTLVCQSFCSQGGGHAWRGGGMCGRVDMHGRGGMHGRGAFMAWGVHGGGHAWQGACMAGGCVWQML